MFFLLPACFFLFSWHIFRISATSSLSNPRDFLLIVCIVSSATELTTDTLYSLTRKRFTLEHVLESSTGSPGALIATTQYGIESM